MTPVVYDIESYPNFFSLTAVSLDRDDTYTWEISERTDDRQSLIEWLVYLRHYQVEMYGFNNVYFDVHFVQALLKSPELCTAQFLNALCKRVIAGTEPQIWQNDRLIPQVDIYLINHFDNKARRTSLKAVEFAMRSASVQDLPFPPGTVLTHDQMDVVRRYNAHDVTETKAFVGKCSDHIEFRRKLACGESSLKISGDVMNFNDTKIGKQYLIQQLGENICYTRVNGQREPRQTHRAHIAINDVILTYIRFQHPEFNRVLGWLRAQNITETKGVFDGLSANINGFQFVFGTGGIHGSVERRFFQADEHHEIIDIDVESLYPSIGIVNGLYPEHLGHGFVPIYAGMKEQRISFAKGTPENAMLKLALNGVYGDSNNIYSPFYDPQYTMATTINGQLSLCMLAEMILQIPNIELIQINTDGLTVRIRKEWINAFEHICKQWEQIVRLKLEHARYSRMWVRDVNSYIAEKPDGKVKLKGAYWYPQTAKDYDGWWHKDFSAMIVQKAAHIGLTCGVSPADIIRTGIDPFDYMIRGKIDGSTRLFIGEHQQGKVCRYHIAREGDPIYTIRPPVEKAKLGAFCKANGVTWDDYYRHDPFIWTPGIHTKNQSQYNNRRTNMHDGWKVLECNEASRFDWKRLDYSWYITEAEKLWIS